MYDLGRKCVFCLRYCILIVIYGFLVSSVQRKSIHIFHFVQKFFVQLNDTRFTKFSKDIYSKETIKLMLY
jgi:hypothetical protein